MTLALKHHERPDRLTIYLGGPDKRELLDWVKHFTGAKSDSEAVLSGLERLRTQNWKQYKKERTEAFRKVRGAWADIPEIDQIFADVRKGWKGWNNRISKMFS